MATAVARQAGGQTVLTVRAGSETRALAADTVVEIIRPPLLTRVPHGPPSLLGVANLRGAVLPVVSLAALLGQAAGSETTASRVVVVQVPAPIGLAVDAVLAFSDTGGGRPIDLADLLDQAFASLMGRIRTRVVGPGTGTAHRHSEISTAIRDTPSGASEALALLGLRVATQDYALPLEKVFEVRRMPSTFAALPRTDTAMLGVTTQRDALLPLVALRVLLGMPADGYNQSTARVVVTELAGVAVGLVVDAVTSTLQVAADAIDPVPPVLTRGRGEAQVEAICRLDSGRRLVCLLSPARMLDHDTMALIQSHASQETDGMSMPGVQGSATEQFLIFRIGEEQYGLPIAAVDEVARRPEALTRLPHAPGFVEGVMNLRGRAIPVIDQRQRFALASDARRGQRVIVMTVEGLQAAFAVDGVSEILNIATTDLQAAPAFDDAADPLFDRVAIKTGGRMILLISPKALLAQAERDLLVSLAETAAVP